MEEFKELKAEAKALSQKLDTAPEELTEEE